MPTNTQLALLVNPLMLSSPWWLPKPFFGKVDMDEVLKKCSWKSHFSEFYLKDINQVRDDLLSLGPVGGGQWVAAP